MTSSQHSVPTRRSRPRGSAPSLLFVSSLALLSLAACSSGDDGVTAGSGGAGVVGSGASTGGASASVGAMATGGLTSTGGASSTGGANSGGGGSATGGLGSGIGGAMAAGGSGSAPSSGGAGVGGSNSAGGGDGSGGSGSGGDGSGGSGSGGESSAGYQPCPDTGPCKILPFGDSITDGIGFSGGYRVELFKAALADGHDITFTGNSSNGPSQVDGVDFPTSHEGHSGWTIQQVDDLIPSPALDEMPHIILLHIGTNDMASGSSAAPGRLETLLDNVIAAAPDALLVVSTIIPFTNVEAYNATIEPMIDERADAGAHILLVDQYTDFPSSELGDGVHPNEAGYARMAGVWYDGISSYLP